MIRENALRNLECEPAPSQAGERIDRVCPIRIHQPGGLRRLRWHGVVVNDANENAGLKRLSNTGAISGSAVNGEDKLNAIFKRGSNRALRDAVTIAVTLRDVALRDSPDCTKGSYHDRRPGQPIRIEITNNKNRLPLFARCAKTRDEPSRIREKMWIVQGAVVPIQELACTNGISEATTIE
jgi:hypothetical protein